MAKKQTNWITIPEETVHTPVSNKKGEPPVKNKLFWGASFVVLIVVTFALLAPSQFNELLRGSLFDAPGAGNPTAGVFDGEEGTEEEVVMEMQEEAEEEVVEEEEEDIFESEPVVQAEDEAVAIAIEPLEEAESIEIEPTAEDCGKDVECFVTHLADCSLAKVNYGYKIMGQSFEADLDLTGEEDENCLVDAKFTKSPLLINLNGKEANCKLEKGEYNESSLQAKFSNPDEALNSCSGSAIDVLSQYASLMGGAKEEAKPEEEKSDAQTDLIEELNAQLEQIQSQRAEDLKAMQDLVDIVQDQKEEEVHAAAQYPAEIPTSINSTANIGQPPAVQPGFRLNPYRVTVTPEETLRQNMAQGFQYAQQSQPVYQQTNYQSVPSASQTPETGPSEVLFITFILTFLGLVSWKLLRTFA